MAATWSQERGLPGRGAGLGSTAGTDAVSGVPLPLLVTQDSRFLLSPVPASLALTQGHDSSKAGSAGASASLTAGAPAPSAASTITLYPVDPVPSHLLCAICTLPYENPVHFLPCCHVFCLECIQLWIGMNLSDDLLQNELRRAYPTTDDERDLALGDATHIQTEEQIKVPVSVSHRPAPSSTTRDSLSLSAPSEWLNRSGHAQGQRPVSGVERRRMRSDRMGSGGSSGRGVQGSNRGEVIDEEVGEDEEIEMEHVGSLRRNTASNHSSYSRQGDAMSPFPSASSSRRPSRLGRQRHQSSSERYIHFSDGRLFHRDSMDGNEDEELQSPTTAVIGRRPSEWMRYQQRQIQAHQEQLQAQRADSNANADDDTAATTGGQAGFHNIPSGQTTGHQHNATETDRYDHQQEQIRRLFQEQESQEELLRTLTARAASIIEAEEGARRRESDSTSPPFMASDDGSAPDSSVHPHDAQGGSLNGHNGQLSLGSEEDDSEPQRSHLRHSLLQIDTTVPRPGSARQSLVRQHSTSHSRHISRDISQRIIAQENTFSAVVLDGEDQVYSGHEPHHAQSQQQGPSGNDEDEDINQSDDNNSDISIFQQETRARVQRPSSLQPNLEEEQGLPPSTQDQSEGDMSVSDSVSDSTRSPTESPSSSSTLPLSPSNDSTLSFRTSSTYSLRNQTSVGTPFSQRSSSQPQWDRHSLSLQMPTIETTLEHCSASEGEHTCGDRNGEQHTYAEQPWSEEDLDSPECRKDSDSGEFSGSTLLSEMSRAESKSRADTPGDCALVTTVESSNDATLSSTSSTEIDDNSRLEACNQPNSMHAAVAEQPDSAQGSSSNGPLMSLRPPYDSSETLLSPSVSPLVRELDITTPTSASQSTMSTIADVQISAYILARARSNSALLSDEDLLMVGDHPSPVDSPIPTPSTARPRQRFPAGVRLAGDEDGPEEEEEEEPLEEEQEEQEEHQAVPSVAFGSGAAPEDRSDVIAHGQHLASGLAEAQEAVDSLSEEVVVTPERSDSDTTTFAPTAVIFDPLSAAASSFEGTDQDEDGQRDERSSSPSGTPIIQPLRATISSSSPPPLPLPLPTPVEGNVSAPSYQEMVELTPTATAYNDQLRIDDESSRFAPESIQPTSNNSSRRASGLRLMDLESATAATSSTPYLAEPTLEPRVRDEDLTPGSTRVETHIQYRTLVRYQPRLPKAHVMSDLISQIRVQCPQREFGCQETMEMQLAMQHGRDQCKYRMVMCPRMRCGIWMRADQILEHILMVEAGTSPAPSSSSSTSLSGSRPNSDSSSRLAGRSSGSGLQQRQSGIAGNRDHQRPRRNHQNHADNMTSISPKQPQEVDPVMASDPSIPPCPGLTWEREQLAKATGIIGQLTEENTSLRQMIRQLTLQNSKLLKDKDRWQRYANLGLGRD
ncbi:hypothetical protein KVV02_005841 [Mortierella alpina]|uniref:RING-type domain-containing protein n=1 Tax=Mortierella alpina TaxID=64518 RepID=A0A9P8A399_MORAP|nr:hypothetical protein KVV02_005841 [Mortierella alpina]